MNTITQEQIPEKIPETGKKAAPSLRRLLLHPAWTAVSLTVLGLCIGVLALMLGATAYVKLPAKALFFSYFQQPSILLLNLLPGLLLIWLFYFLTRRPWAAFLLSWLPMTLIALVNYFKIRLRSDPLLAVDLRLAAEAGGIVGNYTLDLTWLVWFALACGLLGTLFARAFIPKGKKGWKKRTIGSVTCLLLAAVLAPTVYLSPKTYEKTVNHIAIENRYINQWSDVEVFASKGVIYPFLHSFRDLIPTPPQGYNKQLAQAELGRYPDADIPADKKVSVMGIMLEAFCDLTDFPLAAAQPRVAQVYDRWHEFEAGSVHGDLLTNIFAGGTVDSEWGFLTGYSTHDEFRSPTAAYPWYFKDQGYQTFGSHPGYNWFYNRLNVNQYLGFDEYWFTENHYGDLVDPTAAIWNSDHVLVGELLEQLKERTEQGPAFSFSVSYQNHGPYADTPTTGIEYMTPADTGMSEQSCNIWNNYLKGIDDTIDAMLVLRDGLEHMEEPVVLVLFGDHKPWGGNGNSAYTELGADFDLSTLRGFYDYYSTPYLIWANPAAKEALGNDFIGEGGDFSPCFLMTRLFDLCGWEGPGFMQLGRELREISPLLHVRGLYLREGELTQALPPDEAEAVGSFLCAQYFREMEVDPTPDRGKQVYLPEAANDHITAVIP